MYDFLNKIQVICLHHLIFFPTMPIRANKSVGRARTTKKLRRQWNAREKLAAILYHESGHSKTKTAAKFNIETKQLRDWISKKDELLKAQPGKKKLNKGASPKYPALEATLVEWIRERRNRQKAVSRYMIQEKAKSLAQQSQWRNTYPDLESFAFSNKWLDGLMHRNNLSNRRRTTTAQRLPEDLIEQQNQFLSFITY